MPFTLIINTQWDSMNMITIIELLSFQKNTKRMFNKDERIELHLFIQKHPMYGDVIKGTGGLRKLRWSSGGKGKRGGSRIIYYYHASNYEIYLITAYAKAKKEDISSSEKKTLRNLINQLTNKS